MAATFYAQILREWDWEAMVADMDAAIKAMSEHYSMGNDDVVVETGHASASYDGEYIVGTSFLGTVFSVMPSGKYWTFWANSNVTQAEAERDSRYLEALERVADKFDLAVISGEGDPCDLLVCKSEEVPSE
jgi:hypothetical protein